MVLNISEQLAEELLEVVLKAASEFKRRERSMKTVPAREKAEHMRRSMEIIRHRLEYNLGYPDPYTNPKNLDHREKLLQMSKANKEVRSDQKAPARAASKTKASRGKVVKR